MAKKILLVDDELDIVTVTVTRLEKSGYRVVTRATAEEGLQVLKRETPDLILLDLLLPGMQGDEFCKKVKADDKLKGIPVILFTASSVHIPEKAQEMGADDYIMKPFEPEELLAKIQKFIG